MNITLSDAALESARHNQIDAVMERLVEYGERLLELRDVHVDQDRELLVADVLSGAQMLRDDLDALTALLDGEKG